MRIVAIDIETTGLDWGSSVLSIAAAWNFPASGEVSGEGYQQKAWLVSGLGDLFSSPTPTPQVINEVATLLHQADLVAMHNASFDLSFLLGKGLVVVDDIRGKLFDTLLTARMTGPRSSLSLASLCDQYKIGDERWRNMKSIRTKLNQISVESLLEYNALDSLHTLLLAEKLWRESVTIYGEDFTLRESDFCRLMAEVRVRGKQINRDAIQRHWHSLLRERRRILRYILWHPSVRIQSPNDREGIIRYLKRIGYREFNLTKKGNETINRDELLVIQNRLRQMGHREGAMICKAVLRLRHIDKIISTYLEPLTEKHADPLDFVHPSFSVGGTTTFRLSSSEPNGQNMPRELHDVLWTPYLSADYSQAELRLAAAYAQEETLAKAFHEGMDIHLETARRMFGEERAKAMRPTAKNINFLALYGGGPQTLSERYGVSFQDACTFVRLHKQVYPRLHRMTRQAQDTWQSRGYLQLLSGKRIYATQSDLLRGYKAFNNIVQGGVGELVKEAMLRLDAAGIPIIGQVHDSIEFPLGVDTDYVREVMESVFPEHLSTRTRPPIFMKADIDQKGTDYRGT